MDALTTLLKLEPEERLQILKQLTNEQRQVLWRATQGSGKWLGYVDDPVSFVTHGLKEQAWSKQVEILHSIQKHRRTAVPACHAPGKSHIAARAIAWWICTRPADRVRVVTTATTFRQVKSILWPHIRMLHRRHNLPGEMLTTAWKINGSIVADGFSPADHNESAVQGIHADHLMVVVDEAGGISDTIGKALESLTTGEQTRLLLLGNPPTNRMGSFFERACNSELYNVIRISAYDTPAFTGEPVGKWAQSLVDRRWVDDVTTAFGEGSAFVQARVHARFPTSLSTTVIPYEWLDAACDGETRPGRINLGVDVAAGGGDEFAVGRIDGNVAELLHASRGNKTVMDVCSVVLQHIHDAESMHAQRNIAEPVSVKIDAIGLGWGVAGLLEEWGRDNRHKARIVAVNVSQQALEKDKFANQRAEMWWQGRLAVEPEARILLRVDAKTVQQLALPTFRASASGRLQIESKDDLRKRSGASPDRAEAILLALFNPAHELPPIVAPIGLTGTNRWI